MQEFALGYREVIPDQTVLDPWKEITRNTGGTQGTLQDIKIAERANGFCYRDSTKQHTRNRFIYWRINNDLLELVEHSLDINLAGNRIRYRFVDTPILDGVSIHETYENVVVLVPTVCSVHRLVFPHPDKYHRQDDANGMHPDLAAPSIFSEAKFSDALDPSTFHFFQSSSTSSSQLPYLADSFLTLADEEAIFVLAYTTGELLLVRQSNEGKIETVELKNESMVPRFLSGLADRLRQKDKEGDITVSLLLHTFDLETYALTLTRNGHLKFWSCTRGECEAVIDITAEIGGNARNQTQGALNHVLRKAVNGFDSECLIGVFMNFSYESQLHVFKPVVNRSQISIHKLNTLHFDLQNDLIDFTLSTTRIWSVWRGKDGECEVYTALPHSGAHWTPVVLESVPDANQAPNLDGETDPRQAYLEHIFQHGRFPLHIISKALNIYKRSTIVSDLNLSASNLKQRICMAVENEIQNELKETAVNHEEYLECAAYCWQRFYSCCVQYHVAGLKPLGLLLLPNASGAVLLKKSMISFLRPMDILEYLTYENDYEFMDLSTRQQLSSDNADVIDDVTCLFKVINYLEQQMSEFFGYAFEKELALLKSPEVVMAELLEKIQSEMDNEFSDHVAEMLASCTDLYQALHKILELLRVDYLESEPLETDQPISYIFTSQLGISLVSNCLRQQSQVRFTICRNLLLISNILLDMKEVLDWNLLEAVRSVCTPEIVVLTQANYVMVWLSGLTALNYLPMETALKRLSSLKLGPVFNLRSSALNSVSLLELFAGSTGGYTARKAFSMVKHSGEALEHWHLSLLPYLNCLFHIIWPVSGSPVLAEWLLSCGQHLWLQQYVRYLNTWCEWNSSTHTFLLATSFLTTGETHKAQELFRDAAKGVFTDQFLAQRILTYPPDGNETRAYISYFLKVIHLFELHKASDCAINLANTALSLTSARDPLAATLYSIKFKHHLALRNYEMAYDSLNSNPDSNRKKDNLRDLVKKLLDEKKLDVLMGFTYGSMEELFCDIIFTRARATDAANNTYYDFLYAYQVKRGPSFLRLAASVMYEQAFRLNQHNDPMVLVKQVKCYLAAKSALQLCDKQFAYIVMPVEQIEDEIIELPVLAGSDDEPQEIVLRKQVNIINLGMLKKELAFASAKLKLLNFNPKSFFEITNPNELVVLLTSAGLFRTALEIAKMFDVPNKTVFEALTKRCGALTKQNEPVAWEWLQENNVQDLPTNTRTPSDAAWNLLQACVEEYEEEKMSVIHKIVCAQIIKMYMWIPHWLLASYKFRNASELFRLLYRTGRLEEAVEVASEYMLAALGYGKENYGFTHSLTATTPALCLPIHNFVTLTQQLQIINESDPEKPFLKEHAQLEGVLKTYLETAQKTSNEMCHFKSRLPVF